MTQKLPNCDDNCLLSICINCDRFGNSVDIHEEFPVAEDIDGGLVVQEDPECVEGAAVIALCEAVPPNAVAQHGLPLARAGTLILCPFLIPDALECLTSM